MKSSEILLELFPIEGPIDPAESDGFDGVDGFPEAIQQALLARVQGLTSAEFAVQQGD
ncbi:hypothetical protein HY411_03355 [Candidatus Gottesmanbacteria bacterium]|nr:hypothetical protein [Candidatus Gottesmanbacteria bacterium]